TVYSWWQHQLCDVFIELIKPYFAGDDPASRRCAQDTLWLCLDYGLRLLHPFMPFITEELWQRLPCKKDMRKESIMISEYPSPVKNWTNDNVELEMDMVVR
ncbi:valine--tRNA ligase, partial [Phtheirospermum japonicum]